MSFFFFEVLHYILLWISMSNEHDWLITLLADLSSKVKKMHV